MEARHSEGRIGPEDAPDLARAVLEHGQALDPNVRWWQDGVSALAAISIASFTR